MILRNTRLHILSEPKNLAGEAKTGVSLHCHTEHSKEMLDFVPHYAEKLPIINYFWRKERDRYVQREGKGIDFSTAYWTPPLKALEVFSIEEKQINDAGLNAIVSLTDHDSIDANLSLNTTGDAKPPISLEWTVPFDFGFFHVGVHNLPESEATEITNELLDYSFATGTPDTARLHELFSLLNSHREILIVLNHPIWDIEMVGKERHKILLDEFLSEFGRWIHALEINGFRTWSENKAVIELGESMGIPLVTGGDRHGCKPNTVLNISKAPTFDEFVEELRVYKRSEVVLMPEYSQPLHSRQLQSFSEILKLYPEFSVERQRWFDRVYFDIGDGEGLRKLSAHWRRGGPTWLRWAIWTLGVLGSPKLRPAFRLAMHRRDVVPKQSAITLSQNNFISDSLAPESLPLITDN